MRTKYSTSVGLPLNCMTQNRIQKLALAFQLNLIECKNNANYCGVSKVIKARWQLEWDELLI